MKKTNATLVAEIAGLEAKLAEKNKKVSSLEIVARVQLADLKELQEEVNELKELRTLAHDLAEEREKDVRKLHGSLIMLQRLMRIIKAAMNGVVLPNEDGQLFEQAHGPVEFVDVAPLGVRT